jgi:hypothetical protein
MKVGDLVHNVDFDISESPDLGLILEIDSKSLVGTAKYLVQFEDNADWCARHHLELISESR